MTFDRENFLREMDLLKKIPVLENELTWAERVIDEAYKNSPESRPTSEIPNER